MQQPSGGGIVTPPAPAAPLRLLLVEDDDGDALLVTEHLAASPIQVEIARARSLAEAEQQLSLQPADCVLLDLGLPDTSGIGALERMVVASSAAVVVLTGLADAAQGVAAVAAGAQDYLIKDSSVNTDVLVRAVRYAVERRRSERAALRLRESELRSAENSRLELGLLPAPHIAPDGPVRVAVKARPSRGTGRLGGDFYDVLENPDGALLAIVGDVSGHGPDEAALGVSLRIAWRALVLAGVAEQRLLPALAQVLTVERRNEEHYATALMLAVDRRGVARLWCAGHPHALLFDDGPPCTPAVSIGQPLGLLAGASWEPVQLALGPRWGLMLYTDGLVEGRVPGGCGERYGEQRLAAMVGALRADGMRGPQLLEEMVEQVDTATDGGASDDLAVVLLTRTPEADG